MTKNAVQMVKVQFSLGFYNQLFLVPKPNNRWHPILDLSTLNTFFKVRKFKTRDYQTLSAKRRMGHIAGFQQRLFQYPHTSKIKKIRFAYQGQIFQFKALPFGLSTVPMEFIRVVKEVKLMAQARGIRLHQYLDDWLIWSISRDECLHDTQTLLYLCQELGWVVNVQKSELIPKQVFNFVGYQYDLVQGVARPTVERWYALNQKMRSLLDAPFCTVGQMMSLIGLLTATRKTGSPGVSSHAPHSMAPKEELARSRVPGKTNSGSQVPLHSPKMVDTGSQCSVWPTSSFVTTCSVTAYRCIK